MSAVCQQGTESACLAIPSGVTSYSAFATKNVRIGVNELKHEPPDVSASGGCPFPRSKSATADVNASAATEEDISGGDDPSKQERKVGSPLLSMVRINTPPSKSTRVFKGEAEAQSVGIEEDPTPIFQRALSCPDRTSSNNHSTSLISAPVQRSRSWPGSLAATENAVSNGEDGQHCFGSQASGLGPTSSDEKTTALSGTLKQVQTSGTLGQTKESLYKLSNILPPEERAATDPVTQANGASTDEISEPPTNEEESPTLEDRYDSTEGIERIKCPTLEDQYDATEGSWQIKPQLDEEQDTSMEEHDKRIPAADVASENGHLLSNMMLPSPSTDIPPSVVKTSGRSSGVLMQPASPSCSNPATAEGLVGDEVGEPPTHKMGSRCKVREEKSRLLNSGQRFHVLSYTVYDDSEVLHGYDELVIIAGKRCLPMVVTGRRWNYFSYEYTECLATTNGHHRRIGCRKPTQCTDVCATKRSMERTMTAQHFRGFKHLQAYVQAGPSAVIYYTTEGIFGIDLKRLKPLAKGGNATVYTGGLEECYAIKKTPYNMEELNVSYQLHHCNIVELLGVVVIDPIKSPLCYQIMYRMTCDLGTALSSFQPHGLLKHMTNVNAADRHWVLYNAVYTLKQIILGLSYLKSRDVQHGDIKESNILLHKKCACPSIFCCKCSASSASKYSVMLADFDYVRNKDSPDVVNHYNIGGTTTYRAPEQGARRGYGIDHGGPCSDTWSVGIVGVYMLVGHGTSEERRKARQEANIMVRQPHCTNLSPYSEVPCVVKMLNKLLVKSLSVEDVSVRRMVKFIACCLEVDHKERLSPEELLQQLEAV